jgi:hypothetical protein
MILLDLDVSHVNVWRREPESVIILLAGVRVNLASPNFVIKVRWHDNYAYLYFNYASRTFVTLATEPRFRGWEDGL